MESNARTITREEFYAAWNRAVEKSKEAPFHLADLLAEELGL